MGVAGREVAGQHPEKHRLHEGGEIDADVGTVGTGVVIAAELREPRISTGQVDEPQVRSVSSTKFNAGRFSGWLRPSPGPISTFPSTRDPG
jgi:hypothetical protein